MLAKLLQLKLAQDQAVQSLTMSPTVPPPPGTPDGEEDDSQKHTLLVVRKVVVYKIPPRLTSGDYKCGEWLQSDEIWNGRLRIVSCRNCCKIRLEDSNSGELFAACFIQPSQRDVAVKAVIDSFCYFVLRIEDGRGKHAFIGLSFPKRNEAFNFDDTLSDHEKYVQHEQEREAGKVSDHDGCLNAANEALLAPKDYEEPNPPPVEIPEPPKLMKMGALADTKEDKLTTAKPEISPAAAPGATMVGNPVLRGTMEGHTGMVTAIAVPIDKPALIISSGREKSVGAATAKSYKAVPFSTTSTHLGLHRVLPREAVETKLLSLKIGLRPVPFLPAKRLDFSIGKGHGKGGAECHLFIKPLLDALRHSLVQWQPRAWPANTGASIGNLSQGPTVWSKLTADLTTREFLHQPDHLLMMKREFVHA